MHTSSYQHMSKLVEQYLRQDQSLQIIDIGSYDVNGSYKPLFDVDRWHYRGVDLTTGPNVDVVLSTPYRLPFKSHSIDVIVSGQAFEHVEFFWLTWLEMIRVLKPQGYIFLIAPSRGPEHRYPVDCWRFYPDGFRALANYGALQLEQVSTDWHEHDAIDSQPWGDTVGVFRQRNLSTAVKTKRRLTSFLRRLLY